MTKIPSLADLLKAGVHLGHRESKSHPKMKPYVYDVKNGVQVINLVETLREYKQAAEFIKKLAEQGKTILFLGTKPQAKRIIEEKVKDTGIPYVTNHWVGGTITNFAMVSKQIKKLKKMSKDKKDGKWEKYTKKEQADMARELNKLEKNVGGISELRQIPDAMFIIDVKREKIGYAEALKKKIPVVALVDTNVNPKNIDYPIPANDDGIKSLEMMIDLIVQAYLEGKNKKA